MILSLLSSLFAGTLAAASPAAPEPIQLIAEPSGEGVQLSVIGSVQQPFEALYTLEVESDAGNRSVQRGRANLVPGQSVTLISVRLGDVEPGGWEARLLVEPTGGEAYRQTRNAL